MTITILPILCAVLGLLMYLLLPQPKAQEIGRIMFFCGLLVVLMTPGSVSIAIR